MQKHSLVTPLLATLARPPGDPFARILSLAEAYPHENDSLANSQACNQNSCHGLIMKRTPTGPTAKRLTSTRPTATRRTATRGARVFFVGVALVCAALAVFAPTASGQACSSQPLMQGHVCSKPGARCSPPTVGSGSVGKCATEGLHAEALACECQGAPTPSYNMILTPLAPADMVTGVATSTITIVPFNSFTGKVQFTCAVSGMTYPAPTCATPPPATVTGGGSATSQLTLSVVGSTAQGTYKVTVTALDGHGRPPDNGTQTSSMSVSRVRWTIGNSFVGVGIALLAFLLLLALWGFVHWWRDKQASSR
jgi:hypothetical protein